MKNCQKENERGFSRIIALLLVLAMLGTMSISAFAETSDETADYAALFESADGTKSVYCETLAEAVKLSTCDEDTVTLLRDVAMGPEDNTGTDYRLELKKGVTIDLNGKVLSSDRSIMRILNSDTTSVATVTFKNGTLVSAEEGKSQHMMTVANHGSLVLENVKAYCGAYYEDGQIVVNDTEIAASETNVSAVVMISGDGDLVVTDSELVTYGNYHVINTYNTDEGLAKCAVYIKNSVLKGYSTKVVIGCADRRDYTINFLDEKSQLINQKSSGGALHANANADHYLGFTKFAVTAGADGFYTYTYPKTDFVAVESTGEGAVEIGGKDYAQVETGDVVEITIKPVKGWYVDTAVDSNGNTWNVENNTIQYTHTEGIVIVTVEFKQYAARYLSADGKGTYHRTLSAAVKKVTNEGDSVTLQRDVFLGSSDNMSSVYRLNVNVGFELNLNGHVLYSDNSLLRLTYNDKEIETKMTVKNGTLVAGVGGDSQHLIAVYNHGDLVLENVEAYCGAIYENGKIRINKEEVNKSSKGASAVVMVNGDSKVEIIDSLLCTYGNYYVINTYDPEETMSKGVFELTNSHLITYGNKEVFGASDDREYIVKFLDDQSVLTSKLSENGTFEAWIKPQYSGDYSLNLFDSVETDGVTLYNYSMITAYTIIWANYDGTVLETDTNMIAGTIPEYNGQLPQRATDENNAYFFAGWTPQVDAVAGDVTYTATYKAVDPGYQQTGIDLVNETQLYRTQGRPYLTAEGLHMDFAGAAIEFEAEMGGMLTMDISTEKELYFQLYVDGVADDNRIHVLPGNDQTVTLTDYVEPGYHTIRLVRDSDVYRYGETMAISNINFIGVKSTVKATEERSLLIEFVGDSITSGKYTEMQYVEGEAIHKGTNSYAYKTAQLLNADYSMVSRGGCGYFRVSTCPKPAHMLYPYYNGFAENPVAYTTDRKADVVILALGTNDGAANVTESYENGTVPFETFIEAPRYVIGQIRQMHGEDVKIVLLHNMMSSSWEAELREAAQLEGVYFLQVTKNREGGNNHPSAEGHTVIARELTAFLQETVLPEVYVCDGEETVRYGSLQKAVDAVSEGQYIRLNGNVTEDVVIDGAVCLDLNGYTLTGNITGSGTLYGMDAATDEYTAGGRITGTVSCKVEKQHKTNISGAVRRYMAVADENGYTFNRFYIGVTHLNLKPNADGVGYKATIAGNDAVLGEVKNYGYKLWLTEEKVAVATKAGTDLENMNTVTARLQNFDIEAYGEAAVNGSVFIELQDGTVIESTTCTFTLRAMIESIAASAGTLTDTQLSAVKAFVARFSGATANWNIDSLR